MSEQPMHSKAERIEYPKNRTNSLSDESPAHSEILSEIESAALLNCALKTYNSSLGNPLHTSLATTVKSSDF